MYEIEIQNELGYPLQESRLREAITTVLESRSIPDGTALTVVFTANDRVARLNLEHRGIDAPTDVLSFPADVPPVEIPGEPPYLGDLVIAYPYAKSQAEREGHDLNDSLVLLVVHGTLHLLGMDHDTAEARQRMWDVQKALLARLNVPEHVLPSLEGDPEDEEHH